MENVEIIDTEIVTAEDIPDIINMPKNKADALRLLTNGHSVRETAEIIQMHPSSIYKWMKNDETFSGIIKRHEELVVDDLYTKALNSLYEMLADVNPYTRQFAVSNILKLKAKNELNINVKQEPISNLTANDLLAEFK